MVAISREEFRGELPLPFLSQFDRMIPEIRRHGQSALFRLGRTRPELISEDVVRGAFDVFTMLAGLGMSELAYPQPLAMTAFEQLSSSGQG